MKDYETNMSHQILSHFCKNKKFHKILKKQPKIIKNNINIMSGRTENHVLRYNINWLVRIKLFIKSYVYKKIYLNPFEKKIIVTDDRSYWYPLRKISKNIYDYKNIVYHEEKSPYYFGCSCQHLMSKKFIRNLDNYLNKYEISKIIKWPYFATTFEIMWSIFPSVLGFKKWFFNGIHRPRKHFLNINRDDDIIGVTNYLRLYFKDQAQFKIKDKKIIINLKSDNKTFLSSFKNI